MAISDDILDRFVTRELTLQRVEAGLRKKLLRELRALEKKLKKQVSDFSPADVEHKTWKMQRAEKLLERVRQTIRDSYQQIRSANSRELGELATIEQEFTINALNKTVGAEVVSVRVPESTLRELARDTMVFGAPQKEWWQGQQKSLVDRFLREMRQGALSGETNQQLTQRVTSMMDIKRREGMALVRTSMLTVSNQSRLAVYRANADVIKGVQHISTLDDRTTLICIARSGSSWDLATGKALPGSPRKERYPGAPPYHWQCRSVHIPILKPIGEILGRKRSKLDKLPVGTRASMNGQVAADVTFAQWLKARPEDIQKKLLGAERLKLWRGHKITLAQLIDGSGRPLTLDELREIAA